MKQNCQNAEMCLFGDSESTGISPVNTKYKKRLLPLSKSINHSDGDFDEAERLPTESSETHKNQRSNYSGPANAAV
jgi:hypothetical protein